MKNTYVFLATMVAIFVLAILGSEQAYGQVPNKISYQGLLTKSDGVRVPDGSYAIKFELFKDSSGGSPLWTETQAPVSTSRGTYSIILGSAVPFPGIFFQALYLQVTVTAGPTISGVSYPVSLSPRAMLTSAPYALRADTANYAKAAPVETPSGWISSGGIVRLRDTLDNVGIGTTSPAEKLHVVGNVRIEDGTQGAGKVLTSDPSGKASWQTAAGGTSLGAWVSMSANTVYQATTDGFVVGSIRAGSGGWAYADIFADGGVNPTTVRAHISQTDEREAAWCVPVRKNDYWQVNTSGSSAIEIIRLFWIPIGS